MQELFYCSFIGELLLQMNRIKLSLLIPNAFCLKNFSSKCWCGLFFFVSVIIAEKKFRFIFAFVNVSGLR